MKYIANPVEVEAFKIVAVEAWDEDLIHEYESRELTLENGEKVKATDQMMARMEPKVGDYWVIQADGYIYLNPKEVFERKYRNAQEEV